MRLSTSLFAILTTLTVAVQAGHVDGNPSLHSRHARVARRVEERRVDENVPRVRSRRSCSAGNSAGNGGGVNNAAANPSPSAPPAPASTSTTWSAAPSPSPSPSPSPPPPPPPPPPSSSSAPPPASTTSWSNNGGSSGGSIGSTVAGLINIAAGNCGPIGATLDITASSGPNGNINFLNCGIGSGGWTPPYISVSDIITVELASVAYEPNSAFSPCAAYVSTFEQYAGQYGLPAILLASFAMQESGCDPSTVGGAGEQGLMQLTSDKCTNAPGGNCQDPDYNIHTGAQFFSDTLNSNNGDLLLSIGQYNGWFQGMTYADATADQYSGNCRAQNNLDYLHQFLNGWCQNINAYSNNPPLGEYFNLNVCGSS